MDKHNLGRDSINTVYLKGQGFKILRTTIQYRLYNITQTNNLYIQIHIYIINVFFVLQYYVHHEYLILYQ